MKVKAIMTSEVRTCLPQTSLKAAAEIMRETNCGTLAVTNADHQVVGMITDRDICLALGGNQPLASQIKVSEVISGKVFSCDPGDEVKSALKTMRKKKVHRLPVVNKSGNLKGLLSIDDVLLHAGRANGKKNGKITYKAVVRAYQGICEPIISELPPKNAQADV